MNSNLYDELISKKIDALKGAQVIQVFADAKHSIVITGNFH